MLILPRDINEHFSRNPGLLSGGFLSIMEGFNYALELGDFIYLHRITDATIVGLFRSTGA